MRGRWKYNVERLVESLHFLRYVEFLPSVSYLCSLIRYEEVFVFSMIFACMFCFSLHCNLLMHMNGIKYSLHYDYLFINVVSVRHFLFVFHYGSHISSFRLIYSLASINFNCKNFELRPDTHLYDAKIECSNFFLFHFCFISLFAFFRSKHWQCGQKSSFFTWPMMKTVLLQPNLI